VQVEVLIGIAAPASAAIRAPASGFTSMGLIAVQRGSMAPQITELGGLRHRHILAMS
jgi:hypothetical protein